MVAFGESRKAEYPVRTSSRKADNQQTQSIFTSVTSQTKAG